MMADDVVVGIAGRAVACEQCGGAVRDGHRFGHPLASDFKAMREEILRAPAGVGPAYRAVGMDEMREEADGALTGGA